MADWLWLAARVLAGAGAGAARRARLGRPWLGVALALGLQLLWQLGAADAVRALAAHRPARAAPELGGPWGDAVALIVRLHRRKQYHKSRLLRLLRELRRSTAAMPDGVVVLNPQAEILWFNRTAGAAAGAARRSPTSACASRTWCGSPEFVRYLRSGQYAAAGRDPSGGHASSSTWRCRSCPMAPASCWCWCATSRARRGSRRCARTSSPTPRTNCARRSPSFPATSRRWRRIRRSTRSWPGRCRRCAGRRSA